MISLENISFRYPKAGKDIISDFSCSFAPGECVAVTGRNGCGKTTLVRLITGILSPREGSISIDGRSIAGLDLCAVGRLVGCVFQDPSRQLFCPTVTEEIRYGLENMGLDEGETASHTSAWMEFFRLGHLAGAFPGKLSQGEKQRVVLAAVLAMGTRYVVLDEPTSGLDMRARQELGEHLSHLAGEGGGVIFVSHERGFIEKYATRELVMP